VNASAATDSAAQYLQVLDPGLMTTVQDDGRPGYAHLGVPPSGSLDFDSFHLANRLVGNTAGSAVLETTLRGPRMRLHSPGGTSIHVAVTGAPAAITVNGRPGAFNSAVELRHGDVLGVASATAGLRSYIAVSGGIMAQAVMGSRSTDVLSGLGPPVLTAGSVLPLADRHPSPPVLDFVAPRGIPRGAAVLEALEGPRLDWFVQAAVTELERAWWRTTPASNRVGVRLTGAVRIRWRGTSELPPEPMVTGSIQIPPDGQPIVFLNDHPTTGGYPVLAVLTDDSLGIAGQLVPGSRVRLRVLRPT
jgi:biotin-dependent carboxylase-like uncharacterized protein